MTRKRAPEVRNLLAAIAGEFADAGISSEKMVELLNERHKSAITAEMPDILHIGLMKLASAVAARRSGPVPSAQLELFEEFDIPRMLTVTVQTSEGVGKLHKAVGAMTMREVKEHVAEHTRPRARLTRDIAELARMAKEFSKIANSDDLTVDECWNVRKKRRG